MNHYSSEGSPKRVEIEDFANSIPAMCFVCDPNGVIQWCNQRWFEFTGRDPEEMLGWNLEALHNAERQPGTAAVWRLSLLSDAPFEATLLLRDLHGRLRHLLTRFAPVRDQHGMVVRWIGTFTDITEMKQMELDLQTRNAQLELALEAAQLGLRRSEELLHNSMARQQTAMDEDHRRIARDLHDELGQALTGLKMDLDWAIRKHGKQRSPWVALVRDCMRVADSTIGVVRRLAMELRPALLDECGLAVAMEWHVNQFRHRTGIVCTLELPEGPVGISDAQQITGFRIFQECLTNIARHAQATGVSIYLGQQGDCVVLEVKDDGVGVEDKVLEAPSSLGVLGMRERAHLIGAHLFVVSSPGNGTVVTLRMPMSMPQAEGQALDENSYC
jgi:PAS domain S-box-containing protein